AFTEKGEVLGETRDEEEVELTQAEAGRRRIAEPSSGEMREAEGDVGESMERELRGEARWRGHHGVVTRVLVGGNGRDPAGKSEKRTHEPQNPWPTASPNCPPHSPSS